MAFDNSSIEANTPWHKSKTTWSQKDSRSGRLRSRDTQSETGFFEVGGCDETTRRQSYRTPGTATLPRTASLGDQHDAMIIGTNIALS